jgi:hypothetical protein
MVVVIFLPQGLASVLDKLKRSDSSPAGASK